VNKFKSGLFIFIVAMLLSTSSFAKDEKFGYVDLSQIFNEYKRTKEYDAELEKETNAFQEERNKMIESVRDAQGKLALMKEEGKTKMQETIDKQKADLLEFDRQKRTDLTKKRDEKVREILLEIEKIVSDYAKKEGYTMVLNDRVLIYGGENLNITDKILKILNDGYKGK